MPVILRIGCLSVFCMGVIMGHLFSQDTLQKQLEILAADPFYKNAALGISVRDAETGDSLAGIHAHTMLIPASGMKLITTLTGYHLLGKDFYFATCLQHDGKIEEDGTLHGNIYIQGSGDPTLGSDRISGNPDGNSLVQKMVDDIRLAGITCIEGDIIADPTVFNGHPVHPSWKWEDLGNYYAAGAWGLNFNENQYHIYYNAKGKVGGKTSIARIDPEIPGLQIDNAVRINRPGTGDRANIYGGPFDFKRKITGTVPKSRSPFRIKGSLPDPPMFLAEYIRRNIRILDMGGHNAKLLQRTSSQMDDQKVIATYWSPPLIDIIRQTNAASINIYAESIIKTIGYLSQGQGNEYYGGRAIKEFMNDLGLDTTACYVADGSGLSLENRITPYCMTGFLSKMMPLIPLDTLIRVLPEAGKEGTVKNLLVNSPAKGNMWVKSGSMNKILTYSGYCRSASGKFISFSVILNHMGTSSHTKNKKQLEKILDAIYRFS